MNPNSIKYKSPGTSSITRFERIHTVIFDDKKSGELLVANEIKKIIEKNNKKSKKTVLGLATGSSPKGIYKILIDFHKNENLSFKNVVTFNLDEYFSFIPHQYSLPKPIFIGCLSNTLVKVSFVFL